MLRALLEILFPPRCIFCGEFIGVGKDMEICAQCHDKIEFFTDSENLFERNLKKRYCDRIICVCSYSGIIRQSLVRFKFMNKPSYYRALSKLLAEKVNRVTDCRKFDIIVSVPMHKQKQNIRGYNQALLLSRGLSSELKIPEKSKLILRVMKTQSQSLLSKKGRHENIKNAFAVRNIHELEGKSILLVDDILTTGSTVEECGRILKDAGAVNVTAAILASGRKYN